MSNHQKYLEARTASNYFRYNSILLLFAFLGTLFAARNIYYLLRYEEVYPVYLLIYVAVTLFSIGFRIAMPITFKAGRYRFIDHMIFCISLIYFLLLVGLSLLDFFDTQIYDLNAFNYTAYIFASMMLGFIYRAGHIPHLIIHSAGFLLFVIVYTTTADAYFRIFALLPLLAFSTASVYFAFSREDMHYTLFAAKQDLEESNRKLKELSIRDPLTGLYNRRYLIDFLIHQMAIFKRMDFPFSIILGDIDFFKRVNDTYGHDMGDQVLVSFARQLLSTSRESDLVVRYGGEEFMIVLPAAKLQEASDTAERIRTSIENHQFSQISWKITASFGVTEVRHGETVEQLIKRADIFLYTAKQKSRNICICDIL